MTYEIMKMENRYRDNIIDALSLMAFFIILAMLFLGDEEAEAATACRSTSVKHQFDKQNGYPTGRKGYVVDHVCALEMGGLDNVVNMQYQTAEEGKKKDRVERTAYGKAQFCTPTNSTPTRQVFNCKGSKEKIKH